MSKMEERTIEPDTGISSSSAGENHYASTFSQAAPAFASGESLPKGHKNLERYGSESDARSSDSERKTLAKALIPTRTKNNASQTDHQEEEEQHIFNFANDNDDSEEEVEQVVRKTSVNANFFANDNLTTNRLTKIEDAEHSENLTNQNTTATTTNESNRNSVPLSTNSGEHKNSIGPPKNMLHGNTSFAKHSSEPLLASNKNDTASPHAENFSQENNEPKVSFAKTNAKIKHLNQFEKTTMESPKSGDFSRAGNRPKGHPESINTPGMLLHATESPLKSRSLQGVNASVLEQEKQYADNSSPQTGNKGLEGDYLINEKFKMQAPQNLNAVQRSSVYENKSTVTAIPVRTPSYKRNNTASNSIYGSKVGHLRGRSKDLDDTASLHSLSSSLTASFSKNFLSGFYKNKNSRRRKEQIALLPQQYWMKDENCKECFSCGKNFNTFRRKHHCRLCGQIFCNNCTLLISAEKFGYEGKLRICESCMEHFENDYYEDSSDDDVSVINDTHDNSEDTVDISDHLLLHSTISESRHHNDYFGIGGVQDGYTNTSGENVRYGNATDVVSLFGEDDSKVLTESLNAPKMTIPATKQGEALEIGLPDHGKKQTPFRHSVQFQSPASHHAPLGKLNNELSRVKHLFRGSSKDSGSTFSALPEHKHLSALKSHSGFVQSNIFPENSSYSADISSSSNSVAHNLSNGNFKFEFRVNNPYVVGNKNKSPIPRVSSEISFEGLKAHATQKQKVYAGTLLSLNNNDDSSTTISDLTKYGKPSNPPRGISNNPKILSSDPAGNAQEEEDDDLSSGEDERSMSIFAALNDAHADYNHRRHYQNLEQANNTPKGFEDHRNRDQYFVSAHPQNSTESNHVRLVPRSESKSSQRAEASLQRIRTRRKSKSKSVLANNKNMQLFSHSTPNLMSILSNDKEKPTMNDSRRRQKHDSFSKRLVNMNSQSSVEQKSTLSEVHQAHAKALLNQVLLDQETLDVSKWTEFFLPVFRKIEAIDVSAKTTGSLDFRQYVKIKRVPGGEISQSSYVNGIVFSKNNPLKYMPRFLQNPRILLLMFPVSYQKNDNHFLSMQVVLAQEQEYLNSLVSRITALNPTVVFVSDTVSGYALDLLHKAGIVVQFNTKPQVIEKVAKFTEADIANSVDKLVANMKLGRCETFEVKSYLYNDISKTYTFLKGCRSNLGGTILLRGLSTEQLRTVKDTAEFMVFVILSMKLESSLLKDNFIQLLLSEYNKLVVLKKNRKSIGYFSEFVEKFNRRLLSISPSIDFPLPFLLTKTRAMEESIDEMKRQMQKIHDFNDNQFQTYIDSDIFLQELSSSKFVTLNDVKYFAQFIIEKNIESLAEACYAKKRQWEIFFSLSYNMLGTGTHQSISLLYSMVSNKTGTPCIGPQVVTVEYFWSNDITIGQFIENIVSTLHFPCSAACGGTFLDHYRSYVHGNSKIDVVVEKLQSKLPSLKNIILMWNYCKKCRMSSPILSMSDDTWNYSFGKYLELFFWGVPSCMSGLGNCKHDVLRDHVRYFSYNDIVIRLECSSVDIHQLVTPKTKVSWRPFFAIKSKVDLAHAVRSKIDKFYGSVLKRLVRVKLDSKENTAEGLTQVENMKKMCISEQASFHALTTSIYKSTPGDECLQLNSVIQQLHSKCFDWMNIFAEFEKNYLPSEKDIARITASQLKKMFIDSGSSDEEEDGKAESAPFDQKKLNENDGLEKTDATEKLHSEDNYMIPSLNENDKRLKSETPTGELLDGHHIDQKTQSSKTEEASARNFSRQESDLSKHLRNMSSVGDDEQESKVGRLTMFFDQMHFDALSKEFEHHRELERKQMSRRYYKNQMRSESLKPIVDIYKNVDEAVKEPLHLGKGLKKRETVVDPGVSTSKHAEATPPELNPGWTTVTLGDETIRSKLKNAEPIKHNLPLPPVTTTATTTADQASLSDSEAEEELREADQKLQEPSLSLLSKNNSKQQETQETQTQQQEKNSLLKILSSFWEDRSATLWEPLESPLGPNEHIFVESNVLIKEDEPTSLVSFCLSTPDYVDKMNQSFAHANAGISAFDPFENPEVLESLLNKKTAMHLRYQLQDGNVVMSCKMFFAEQFDAFRRACGCTTNFIQSLSRCAKWDSSGGKSGSAFLKTLDDRFVIKELSHVELDTFIKFAPNYFHYMGQAMFHDLPTALAKILGFYQIHIKNTETGKVFKKDVIITENLFYDKKNLRIFDLKGSMRNRHVEQTGKANEVLLDENMVEYIYESPVFVREYDKKLLRASLWNDTLFLSKMNVMDYSLVIGIDSENQRLTVGIIDCIRTFTWDKKLESWVKEKGFVGNSTKEPTVVTPKQYKNRFREAMERYILVVPDPWFKENMSQAEN